jgi:hypothetical protein
MQDFSGETRREQGNDFSKQDWTVPDPSLSSLVISSVHLHLTPPQTYTLPTHSHSSDHRVT